MAIELATQFLPYVDEQFKAESKRQVITNNDFEFTGAHSVKVYKVTTSAMNDYDREGKGASHSRYGQIQGLDATTEEFTLKKDRSFTFALDKLDVDETKAALQAAAALARQLREVVIPEVDTYVYGKVVAGAGTTETGALTDKNVYDAILKATEVLDTAEVPETNRVLLVTPDTYTIMKKNASIVMATDVGQDMRKLGVIGMLDGATIIKVPKIRLPEDVNFVLVHPSATVAPVKLEDYKIHKDPPGISGNLVEGRIAYDAFVLENKTKGIYVHKAK
nr:MAG TPA: major capsid protein [Caudoviricetes sp.]